MPKLTLILSACALVVAAVLPVIPSAGALNETLQPRLQPNASWFGVYPDLPGYTRSFRRPLGFLTGSIYSQTAQYHWIGQEPKIIDVTYGRNKLLNEKLQSKARAAVENGYGRLVHAGTYDAWHLGGAAAADIINGQTRQAVFVSLTDDKFVLLEARQAGPWEDITEYIPKFNLARIESALSSKPRSDFKLSLASFKRIVKGTPYSYVLDWLGAPSQDIYTEVHSAKYTLQDGSIMLISFDANDRVKELKSVPALEASRLQQKASN